MGAGKKQNLPYLEMSEERTPQEGRSLFAISRKGIATLNFHSEIHHSFYQWWNRHQCGKVGGISAWKIVNLELKYVCCEIQDPIDRDVDEKKGSVGEAM